MVKASKKSITSDGSALALATGTLQCGLQRIAEYVEDPETADLGSDSADTLARLLTKVAQVAGELRKADAEERRQSALNSPEAIVAAIRGLSARERQTVQGELERMSSGTSGLA